LSTAFQQPEQAIVELLPLFFLIESKSKEDFSKALTTVTKRIAGAEVMQARTLGATEYLDLVKITNRCMQIPCTESSYSITATGDIISNIPAAPLAIPLAAAI